jgi:hypothetical protein
LILLVRWPRVFTLGLMTAWGGKMDVLAGHDPESPKSLSAARALAESPTAAIISRLPVALLALFFVIQLTACGGGSESDATPEPVISTAPTQGAGPATTEELSALAEATYPYDDQNDYYFGCDTTGYDSCPITDRLRARLEAVQESVNASLICRCQNVSDTREITVTPTESGGTALVSLFEGETDLELIIVEQDDQLLVDDVRCVDDPQSSLYLDTGLGPCDQ